MIYIRKAGYSDAQIISFLGRITFTETFTGLFSENELNEYLEETFSIKKLGKSLLKHNNIFGIIYYQDNPVGYYKVKMGMHYDHSADENYVQLQKIYILKDCINMKLGKEMLRHIYGLKEMESCKTIWLVVLNTNYRAIHFYLHQGFEKFKKYHHQIGSHNLEYELMTKAIFL